MTNNIEIIQGDDTTIRFTITDQDGDVVDLSTADLVFSVINDFDSTSKSITATTASGLHTEPASGLSYVFLSHDVTNVDPGNYYWDIELRYGNGMINSVKHGKLTVIPDVT
jgi:hypothetical protein